MPGGSSREAEEWERADGVGGVSDPEMGVTGGEGPSESRTGGERASERRRGLRRPWARSRREGERRPWTVRAGGRKGLLEWGGGGVERVGSSGDSKDLRPHRTGRGAARKFWKTESWWQKYLPGSSGG